MVGLLAVVSIVIVFTVPALYTRKCQYKCACRGKKLGGVCSGLAKGMNLRAFWVRLGFLLSIPIVGYGLWLYLVLWLVLPKEL